jgi:D-3-phosphoglycerate dehydrogenase/C-terminal binding protein
MAPPPNHGFSVSRFPSVVIVDAPGGGYLERPDVETGILNGIAQTRLEVIAPDEPERLLRLDADYVILWHRVSLNAEFFETARRCRAVVCASVGYDHVDLAAAHAAAIPLFHVPDYGTEEVADHTVALALALARALPRLRQHTLDGGWDWRAIGAAPRLRGRVWGIVGLGRIGNAVLRRAEAFGMRCVFYDPYAHPGIQKGLGIERLPDLAGLLEVADIVSVHVPLSEGTRHLLGAAEFSRMKPGSILVNTARGAVVDIDALPKALDAGAPGLVGLDVVEGEPAIPPWLREHPQALVTPHAAFCSVESLIELRTRAAEAIAQLITGQPVTSAFPVETRSQSPDQPIVPAERSSR